MRSSFKHNWLMSYMYGTKIGLVISKLFSFTFFIYYIGFWHEQARYDRNEYVKINWQNMKWKKRKQFGIRPKEYSEPFEKDLISRTSYDYCSIMHYNAMAWSTVSYHLLLTGFLYKLFPLFFLGKGTDYWAFKGSRLYVHGTAARFYRLRLEENQPVVQM